MPIFPSKLRDWLRTGLLVWCLTFSLFVMFASSLSPALAVSGATKEGATAEAAAQASEAACPETGAVPTTCPPRALGKVLNTIWGQIIVPIMKAAFITVVIDVAQYVLDTIAYNTAVWLASGAPGQTPLVEVLTGEDAWKQFGYDVLGESIGSLSESLSDYADLGFSLCAPPNDFIRLGLQLGLQGAFQPPEPKCDWQSIQANYEGFVTNITDQAKAIGANPSEYMLTQIGKSLKPGQNTLDYMVQVQNKTVQAFLEEKQAKFAENLAKGGFKDVTSILTGSVVTPAEVVRQQTEETMKSDSRKQDWNVMASLTNPDLMTSLWQHTLSVFTNTLLSELLKKVQEGLIPETSVEFDPFSEFSADIAGREEAAEFYSNLVATTPSVIADYSVLTEFITCASGSVVRQVNNCVMDSSLFQAVARGDTAAPMTVQEALDAGYLHGSWPLYPPDDVEHNQDTFCYTYGYCYGNLVKMRKARILPIGWELAASSPNNESSSPVTLQQVVDGFDQCNSDGNADGSNPWCHLIDPNWVIKYPQTQCRASVIGEQMVSTLVAGRSGACVDTPSCISQTDDGVCLGYGYCVREKNVWNFRGDECPAEYAGCLAFTNTDTSESGNWLASTLNYDGCSADNAGCLWYRTNKYFDDLGTTDDDTDDVYAWLPTGETYRTGPRENDVLAYTAGVASARETYNYDTDGDGTNDYSYDVYAFEDRVYYNNQVQTCAEEDAGCTQLYQVEGGLSLNMLRNPSFEADEDGDSAADEWETVTGTPTYDTGGAEAYHGSANYALDTDSLRQSDIPFQQNRFYTVSFYAKGVDAASAVTARLEFVDTEGVAIDLTGYSSDCTTAAGDTVTLVATDIDSEEYESFDCAFTTPILDDERLGIIGSLRLMNTDTVKIDALQLEARENATNFHEGYNDSSPTEIFMTVAPDYLGCTGAETDPAACDDYAPVCAATEVGCALYTPEDGDPSVPAVVSSNDLCPDECVGYATWKQEETDYEPEEFPLYFIESSATTCSEEYVGCDEFTNLETEATETFSYVRACVTTEMDPGAVFFTWEGSDLAGYQLVSYQLLESQLANGGSMIRASGDTEENIGRAPCTTWEVTSETELACADVQVDLEAEATCDEHDDILTNPDCREFYDSNGDIHYRLFSDTVSVSDECTPYRKTESTQTDCDASGGYWTAAGECRYFVFADESTECPAEAAGCRAYTGGAGRNATTILESLFEGGTYDEYMSYSSATLDVSNESVAIDGHSLRVVTAAAHSGAATLQDYYDDSDHGATCGLAEGCSTDVDGENLCTISDDEESCGTLVDELAAGKTYLVQFWAKGSGDIGVGLFEEGGQGTMHDFADPDATVAAISDLDAIELTGSWELYELGPIDTSEFSDFDDNAIVVFVGKSAGQTFYLDNIQLIEAEENVTVIKDSWVTPSTCDETPDGASAPQYYLGCEAYTDDQGEEFSIYQFSNLCSEQAVGCEAFYETQQSASQFEQIFNATCYNPDDEDGDLTYAYNALDFDEDVVGSSTACTLDGVSGDTLCTIPAGSNQCQFDFDGTLPAPLEDHIVLGPETVVVPADEVVYLINDGTDLCSAGNMGCTEVGLPTFSQDKTVVESFESAYVLNLPDSYGDILCTNETLFCAEWASTQDGNFYFKNPGDQNCEYKTNIVIGNQTYSGWFREGTSEFCYGSGTCSDDDTIDCSNDAQCAANDAGTCVIDEGEYIQGGDFSGIWQNGDQEYEGWAAACDRQYDLCAEFVDPMDTGAGEDLDGASYYFLDNASMSEEELLDAERCNGQVSLDNGCVLMNDRVEQEISYSSSPTYLVSQNADLFFGSTPGDLVNPVSCEDPDTTLDGSGDGEFTLTTGEIVNVCTQRCRYQVQDGEELTGIWLGDEYDAAGSDYYFYGFSCLEDSDCPAAFDERSNPVEGDCRQINTEANWFENDTNRVLKVYRDRECAQWLSGNNYQSSWDERTQTWTSVSQGVGLCDAYSGSAGDNGFCTSWVDTDPIRLDPELYVSRDVSWWGLDYSGYAIPEQLPIETYSQVDINPAKACSSDETGADYKIDPSTGYPVDCDDDAECATYSGYTICATIQPDYRLVYAAGSCSDENGETCTVGFCEESGLGCSDDADCDLDESCIVGYCETPDRTGATCSSDDECTGIYDDCKNGVCTDTLTGAGDTLETCSTVIDCTDSGEDTDGDGADDVECAPGALAMTGACYNGSCLTDIRGLPLALTEAQEQECRGYPETMSPFPIEVVAEFVDPNNTTTMLGASSINTENEADAIPYNYVTGFNDATTCSPSMNEAGQWDLNNDCICSYDKAIYGEGLDARYYPQGTSPSEMLEGICSGGETPGAQCSSDDDCNEEDDETPTGSCTLLTRKDTFFGWNGFCIERDISVQVNGGSDEDDQACLTWLPVDQLEGATDIYAKYTSAGYPLEETYYCAEVGYYRDFYPTGAQFDSNNEVTGIEFACASTAAGLDDNNQWEGEDLFNNGDATEYENDQCNYHEYQSCFYNVWCPSGYIALVGYCNSEQDDCTDTNCRDEGEVCQNSERNENFRGSHYDDCPFFCVPMYSYDYNTGEKCDVTQDRAHSSVDSFLDDAENSYSPSGERFGSGSIFAPSSLPESVTLNAVLDKDGGQFYADQTFDVSRYGTPFVLSGDIIEEAYLQEGGVSGPGGGGSEDEVGRFMRCVARGIPTSADYTNNGTGLFNVATDWEETELIHDLDGTLPLDVEDSDTGIAGSTWEEFYERELEEDGGYWIHTDTGGSYDFGSYNVNFDENGSVQSYLGCYQIIQATTDDLNDPNKAWTNRTWTEYPYTPFTLGNSSDFEDNSIDFDYAATTLTEVAGRALFTEYYGSSNNTRQISEWSFDTWPLPLHSCNDGNTAEDGKGLATTPIANEGNCDDGINDYPGVAQYYIPTFSDTLSDDQFITADDTPNDLGYAYEDIDESTHETLAVNGTLDPDEYDEFGNSTYADQKSVSELLTQYFAKTYAAWQYNWWDVDGDGEWDGGGYEELDGYDQVDVSDVGDVHGLSENSGDVEEPQIASIGECFGTQCVEGSRGAFSVNDTDTGNIVGDNGAKHVNVKFFGWADNNQMPLKNVIVDWGDARRDSGYEDWAWPPTEQSGSTAPNNFYKNHRGMDEAANGSLTAICDSEDEWGLQAATCETAYFNFTHDYVCSSGLVATLPTCELADDGTDRLLNSPCTGGDAGIDATSACVFQPRVHLKDNWGWCTGFCDTAAGDGTDGCYVDECDVTECPSENIDGVGAESTVCPDFFAAGTNNPWINFDGYVIVQP